jgi:hypothetical protein
MNLIQLDGGTLSFPQLFEIVAGTAEAELAPSARERMNRA